MALPTQFSIGNLATWLASSTIPVDRQLVAARRPDGTVQAKFGNGSGLFAALPDLYVPEVYFPAIRPEHYKSASDPDDTASIIAAFAAANALARPGVLGTIHHPGATVVMDGVYDCTTAWSSAVTVSCNVQASSATVTLPAAYAGVGFLVGHGTSGDILQGADIAMPDVLTANTAGPTLTAGSVGVKVQNLYGSRLRFGRVAYFETGIHFTGLGNGTAYNEIFLGWISYCKVATKLIPGPGGWVNQNTFIGGGFQQSSGFTGGYRVSGWKHVYIDGAGINGVNGNTFVGVSFEGDVSAIAFDIRHASQNTFYGCRSEPGRAGRTINTTAASTSIALTAHALAVGDMVIFGGTLPAALNVNVPYFVVGVADADHFTVSSWKGGTAITMATTTSTGLVYQPHRVTVDASTYAAQEIHFLDTAATLKNLEFVITGTVSGITQDHHDQRVMDARADADRPLWRIRNSYSSAPTRALVAAYAPTVNPAEDPNNWAAALSDRGLLFSASRAETGRLYNVAGILSYLANGEATAYEIASCRRSPGLIAITSLSCAANTTTGVVITLTGASVNDHVLITPSGALPAGLVWSDARVTSTNNVTVTFGNLTGSTIVYTGNVQAIAIRRFL